jgi:hypothetical protein
MSESETGEMSSGTIKPGSYAPGDEVEVVPDKPKPERTIKCGPFVFYIIESILQADERFVPADAREGLVLFTAMGKKLIFDKGDKDDAWAEIARLRSALDDSVKLQSHYAELLNMHDGGRRKCFWDGDAWLARLDEVKKERNRRNG